MKVRTMGLLLACLLPASACGRRDVSVTTPDGQVKIDSSGGSVVITGPKGEVVTADASGGKVVIKGPKGEIVTADSSGGKVTIKSKEGEFVSNTGGSLSLPGDFPKDAPVYPGAMVMQTIKVPKGHNITLQTNDSAKKVWDFYSGKLTQDGWMEQGKLQNADGSGTISAKKGNRICAAILSAGDNTTIQLTVVEE